MKLAVLTLSLFQIGNSLLRRISPFWFSRFCWPIFM